MPLIDVSIVQGRSAQKIRSLITALTEAACSTLDAPAPSVRVLVREIPPEHWAAGAVTIAERSGPTQ